MIRLKCELCGKDTGVELKLGDLLDKLPSMKPEAEEYLHGMCKACEAELAAGAVFFVDAQRRVMKVSKEATAEKIDPVFHGKVVKIPNSAMQELLKSWTAANGKPPGT